MEVLAELHIVHHRDYTLKIDVDKMAEYIVSVCSYQLWQCRVPGSLLTVQVCRLTTMCDRFVFYIWRLSQQFGAQTALLNVW